MRYARGRGHRLSGLVIDALELIRTILGNPRLSRHLLPTLGWTIRGHIFSRTVESEVWQRQFAGLSQGEFTPTASTRLEAYFDSHRQGRGVWKWKHAFPIYDRHFRKFIGREVHVLEVGVYSGGSLEMWKQYFGEDCQVYGVDIQDACRIYEDESTKIFIGDQESRDFWRRFKQQVPYIDILIDDGGHAPEQQLVTLEEMLPHLRPGGVYLCEDTFGVYNLFVAYVQALANALNRVAFSGHDPSPLTSAPTPFQALISSIHFYPFVTVIEKTDRLADKFVAPKQGTEWQPHMP
jgi:methyltransferase family protein